MTEMTKTTGWVLIDAGCGMCRGEAARWRRPLADLGYRIGPLQPAIDAGAVDGDQDSMCVITPDRRRLRGADGIAALLRAHPATWALGCLLALPGAIHLARRGYAAIAARRHRFGCALEGA